MSKHACELISDQIKKFNSNNSYKYLSNIAYACYKLKRYKEALNENKKILKNQELRGVWYTVIASLIVTIAFGVLDNHLYLKSLFERLTEWIF